MTNERGTADGGTGADDAAAADTRAAPRPLALPDEGGDPACWLNQVCDACGRLIEDPLADVCPNCGASR